MPPTSSVSGRSRARADDAPGIIGGAPAQARSEPEPLDDTTPPRPGSTRPGEPPGLREQLNVTRDAATGMARAHLELARAEFSEIADQLKRLAALVGLGIGCALLVALLLPLGITLFVGEWLFGSIGWGVLIGSEALLAVALAALLSGVGVAGGKIGRAAIVGLLVAIVIGVAFGLNLTNHAWSNLADQVAGNVAPEWRVLVVAVGSVAIALGILLALVALLRHWGIGGAIGLLVVGLIIGAALGALSAISYSQEVAAAIGVVAGLAVWALLTAAEARTIDPEDLKRRFWPQQTIDTTKETIEWVRAQTPLGPRP